MVDTTLFKTRIVCALERGYCITRYHCSTFGLFIGFDFSFLSCFYFLLFLFPSFAFLTSHLMSFSFLRDHCGTGIGKWDNGSVQDGAGDDFHGLIIFLCVFIFWT